MSVGEFFAYLGLGAVIGTLGLVVAVETHKRVPEPYRNIIPVILILLGIFAIGFAVGSWLGI